jgi:hypothetical protein
MMPFDPNRIPQMAMLRQAVVARNLVPFVGAGISRQASPIFPSWNILLHDMKDNAIKYGWLPTAEGNQIDELLAQNQFLMAAQDLKYRYPTDAYERFLQDKFDPPGVGPANIHRALIDLNSPLILTTNYDGLLEDAYAARFGRNATVWTYGNAPQVANFLHRPTVPGTPYVFKIHGSINDPPGIILSEHDYRDLIYEQPGYRMVLSAIFITKVVLMLGFSFADYELRLLLEAMRESLQHRSDPDYIFLRSSDVNDVQKRRYREDYGLEVITYDPTPGDPEVLQFINALGAAAPSP